MKPHFLAAALACALTLAIYAACAHLGTAVFGNDDPNEAVYNRLIDGFAQGPSVPAPGRAAGLRAAGRSLRPCAKRPLPRSALLSLRPLLLSR